MFTKTRNQLQPTHRPGISIVEVLTSMAVAAIGVFGVMVMIPFAVKQSQSGLDNDAANALGRNGLEELQTRGYLRVEDNGEYRRLMVSAREDGSSDPSDQRFTQPCDIGINGFDNERSAALLHFDPIGFAGGFSILSIPNANGRNIDVFTATTNRLADIDLDGDGSIDLPRRDFPIPLNSALNQLKAITAREANLLFRSRDDLQHEEGDINDGTEVAPPQPVFDMAVGTNEQIKRQFSGRVSWSAFLVPEKDPLLASAPVTRFRAYSIAYKDRNIIPFAFYETNMAVTDAPGVESFRESVNEISLSVPVPTDPASPNRIFKNDWVMLINRLPQADPSLPGLPRFVSTNGVTYRAAGQGYRTQIMFARVTRVNSPTSLTVDGGAFDFVPAGLGAPNTDQSTQTYMVHIRDAVNVFERLLAVER